MAIFRIDILGSPNIGICAITTDRFTVIPTGIPPRKAERIEKYLQTELFCIDIGDTKLNGVLAAANSNGAVLPHFVNHDEISAISSGLGVNAVKIQSKQTAFGNLILANDRGAIVDPNLPRKTVEAVEDALAVEAVPSSIAGLSYVGALATVTNRGVLAHPMMGDDEKKRLEEVLKVPVDVGTVNCGIPYVKSGLLANSKGALAGSVTTGPEIVIIGQTLDVN